MQEQYWTSHAVLQKRNGEPPSLAHGKFTGGPMRARRIWQHELGKALRASPLDKRRELSSHPSTQVSRCAYSVRKTCRRADASWRAKHRGTPIKVYRSMISQSRKCQYWVPGRRDKCIHFSVHLSCLTQSFGLLLLLCNITEASQNLFKVHITIAIPSSSSEALISLWKKNFRTGLKLPCRLSADLFR